MQGYADGLMDHMFQGRLKALPVDRDASLQRVAPMTLQDCLREFAPRGAALPVAYRRCGITMTRMAAEMGLSVSHISRLIAAAEQSNPADSPS